MSSLALSMSKDRPLYAFNFAEQLKFRKDKAAKDGVLSYFFVLSSNFKRVQESTYCMESSFLSASLFYASESSVADKIQ